MRVKDAAVVAGLSGFYYDDQLAIRAGAKADGMVYLGDPVTPGFTKVRQPAECASIILILEDGQIATGDCTSNQYSGAGGRDPLFDAKIYVPFIEKNVLPMLRGLELTDFRSLAVRFDNMEVDGKRMLASIRYGISQAILDAVAKSQHKTMAEVVADEYGLEISPVERPIYAQTGDERYSNVDKMILKQADVIPHGLFNTVDKIGHKGEALREYLRWIVKRIDQIGEPGYCPIFQCDVYGLLGKAFDDDLDALADALVDMEKEFAPHALRFEYPIDGGSKERTIQYNRALKAKLAERGCNVKISVDEWNNTLQDMQDFIDAKAVDTFQVKTPVYGSVHHTIEAILLCKRNGVGSYLGGSCTDTDKSTQVSAHIALATQVEEILAKPGMGVDEGMMLVRNEMRRTLAILRMKGRVK